MPRSNRVTPLLACLACFLAGWLLAGRGPAGHADADTKKPLVFPMSARMGANVYLSASAEYRACCHTIYKSAALRLEAILKNASPRPARPAVIMDLDETVVDNTAFQSYLYMSGKEYSDDLWDDYEKNHPQDVGLIPGAREFIASAESLGVTVIYLSNRMETSAGPTAKALELNKINVSGIEGRLFLKPKEGPSGKAARREAVAVKYNVLMYFGDNLRDFSDSFAAPKMEAKATADDYRKANEKRAALADDARAHWGVDWFVLPNPVYGEWDKLIGPDPKAILRPTTMKGKAPK